MTARSAPAWAIATVIYVAITVVLFAPSLGALNTTIIGPYADGDNFWHVWQIDIFRRALLTGTDPAFTDRIYALIPGGVPIFVENWLSEFTGAVLSIFATPLVAYNLLVISSFTLSAITAYGLASEFVRVPVARFAAGFLYAFTSYHLWRSAGHLGEVTTEFLPLFAWRLIAVIRRPTALNGLWCALSLATVPLSEVYYGPYFALPFTVAVCAGAFLVKRGWYADRRRVVIVAVALAAGTVLALVPLRSFLAVPADARALVAAYAASSLDPLSADALAFVVPNPANPLFGHFTAALYATFPSPYPIEEAVYLGWIALCFAVLAWLWSPRRRAVLFWSLIGLIGVVLALGPHLHVAGRALVPLPFYDIVYHWPVLSSFRAPNRLVVLDSVALSVLAALAIEAAYARFRSRRGVHAAVAVALALSLTETLTWSIPLPVKAAVADPAYRVLAAQPGDEPLLELPILNSGSEQFAQITHHHRLVAGFTSRITPRMTASVHDLPYVPLFDADPQSAIVLSGARATPEPPRVDFAGPLRARGIRYVTLHAAGLDADSYRWSRTLLDRTLSKTLYDGGPTGISLWKV